MAWRVQDDTERVLIDRAIRLRETTGARNLCIAGGVGLNCVANGRIVREAGFDNVWIQPAAGDDGIAIGCAYYGHLAIAKQPRSFVMDHAYLGIEYPDRAVNQAVHRRLVRLETTRTISRDICADTARLLAEGHVFGWLQGRSEFGPRALGNRSIIADPRKPEMKDKLNKRVKHRQAFRPFAPIVLAERAAEIFEGDEESPFMLIAKRVRAEWQGGFRRSYTSTARRACRRCGRRRTRASTGCCASSTPSPGAGAAQHLLQRQGRADRGDAGRCHRLLPVDGHRLSGPA